MNAFQSIFLGILQGLAEFLPISSSGHLVLAQTLMGLPSTGLLLEIMLHVGTLVAVLAVFWRDIAQMLRNPFRDHTVRMLIIATIPAVAATLLLGDAMDRIFEGWFLGLAFLITGGLLFGVEWLVARRPGHGTRTIDTKQALVMGLLQAVAIVPGISRSGATIAGGLASGASRRAAAKFSFLMSAIATLGSLVYKFKDLLESGGTAFQDGFFIPLLGVIAAAVSGYAAIRWMLALIQRVSFKWFGLYVTVLGALVLCDQLFFGVFFPRLF